MHIQKIFLALCLFLLVLTPGWSQKNITKPNLSSHNGVSVNTYTGALFHQRQDLFIPGRGLSLDLTFSYSNVSLDRDWGYGRGWTHSYNMAYYMDTTDLVIVHMDGSRNRYVPNGSGGYSCPAGNFDSLEVYQANRLRLTNKEGMKYFFDNDNHKKLTRVEDRNGNAITLSYSDTMLVQLTDPSGRMVNLSWQDGRMTTITDPNTSPARTVFFEYDLQGNPTKVTNPLGDYTEYIYDDNFKLKAVTNQNGSPLNIDYNSLGSVSKLISCVGVQQISYNYSLLRTYVVERVGGNDQITTYQFDASGRLTKQTGNCCGVNVQFEYDTDNNVTKRIDANGNATTYTYDRRGNVLTETDPLGNTASYTYESQYNQMASETDRNGRTTSYRYDGNGNLIGIDKPLTISETFTYDAFGNPLTYTDGRGNTTAYTYDVHGNLLTISDPENGTVQFTYDGVGNNTSVTDQNGQLTTFEYDLNNRQTKHTNALNDFVAYTYDAVGNQLSYRDENDHTTLMVYDAVNRLESTTDPLGNVFTYNYDEKGNVTALIAENGDRTTFEYDALNRLIFKTNPVGDVTSYTYDGVGNLSTVLLPGGNQVSMSYDPLNRMQTISDNLGSVSTYTYDNNSNRLTTTDGNNNITKFFYDELNRIVRMEDPKGKAIEYGYDKNFNLVQVRDRKNNLSSFTYDRLNRRTASTNPLSHTTSYSYDPVGNLTGLIDANNNATSYTYDALNRRINEIYANGDTRIFAFDPVGNLIARTEPNGYTINYNYDEADRLTARNYPGGVVETFTYDVKGRILSAINRHAQVNLTYDGADRLVSENLNGRTTSYAYNTAALTRQINYPGGKQVLETYDQRGRLNRIDDSDLPGVALANFEYDPGNRLLRKIFGNSTSSDYAYDVNSNVTRIQHLLDNQAGFEYGYDDNDNKLYERNIGTPSRSNQYVYDPYNRLTRFKEGILSSGNIPSPTNDILYSYDGVHNRSSLTVNGTSTTYTPNNLNQYTMLSGGTTASLSYDNNGNLTADGGRAYTYDFENRLSEIDAGTTAQYFYDALGRRILKVAGSDSTHFYYAETKVVEERGNNGVLEATYVYGMGDDEVVNMRRNGASYYYYYNALGSVTHLADADGMLAEQYEYDAYGNITIFDGAGIQIGASLLGNPYLFTGQRYDAESGLHFYKARYYSSQLGRFLQRDPLGYIDGPSLYEYVFSNPANWVDPLGLNGSPCEKPWWEDCAVGAGLGALGGAIVFGLPGALAGAAVSCGLNVLFGSNPLDSFRQGNYAQGTFEALLDIVPIPAVKIGGRIGGRLLTNIGKALKGVAKKLKGAKALFNKGLGDVGNVYKSRVQNPKLKNIVNDLFRPNAKIGNGSSMDAFRYERATGDLVGNKSHGQKIQDYKRGLEKLINRGDLSKQDRQIANDIINDINNALKGN
ncbi:MAG: RHS repeat-associated core domain-containing protein [Bacteroidota bacterium]